MARIWGENAGGGGGRLHQGRMTNTAKTATRTNVAAPATNATSQNGSRSSLVFTVGTPASHGYPHDVAVEDYPVTHHTLGGKDRPARP